MGRPFRARIVLSLVVGLAGLSSPSRGVARPAALALHEQGAERPERLHRAGGQRPTERPSAHGSSAAWQLPQVRLRGRSYDPLTIDGHVHTRYSPDAFEPAAEVLALAKRAKLDAVVITDHGLSSAASDVRNYEGSLLVALGEEVGGSWGHAVMWNIEHRRGVADSLSSLDALATHVHAGGGLLALAHPTWHMRRHDDPLQLISAENLRVGGTAGSIDAFELWNSIYLARQEGLIDAWLTAIEAGVFVPVVGASDFHNKRTHKVGRPRTVALVEQRSLDAMFDAYKHGRSYITDEAGISLTIDERATFGDVHVVESGAVLRVNVEISAPRFGGTLVVYQGRREVLRERLPKHASFERHFELRAADHDDYVRAEILRPRAQTGRPRFSLITNPILLDVAPSRPTWR